MKTITTISEIKAAITEAAPPFLCLQDEEGNKLIPWNPKDAAGFPKEYLTKILKRLEAKVTGAGVYYVCFAENVTPKSIVQKITYIKGGAAGIPAAPPVTIAAPAAVPDVSRGLSYEKALELIQENAELKANLAQAKAENTILKKEIEELEDELAGYENQEEKDGAGGLFEGPEMKQKVSGIIDLLAAKFLGPAETPGAAISQAPAAPQKIALTYEMICHTFNTNPEMLKRLLDELQQQQPANGAQTPAQ